MSGKDSTMTEDKRLATVQQQVAIPNADQLNSMLVFAENAVKSGLLPSHIKTPQAAFAVIQMGQELRIPPMAALRGIYVINGKPTCDAAMMQALIYRDHGDNALVPVESTAERCTYKFKRGSWSEYQEFTYSKDDAKAAGLWGNKGPWTTYPRDMLRSRCISVIARMAFQDTVSGLYTPEELGADVTVSPDGEMQVIDVSPSIAPQSTSADRKPVNLTAPEPEIVATEMATQRQIGLISKLAEEAGYDESSLKSVWIRGVFGCDSRKELTKEQASELIHKLQVSAFAERLKVAESERDLNLIAADIKEAGIVGQERKGLGDVYSKRLDELTSSEGDEELDKAFDDAVSQVELS